MAVDLIHDIQAVYRKLVDSMSRPGMITELGEQAGKVDLEKSCYDATVLLALTFLDTEVTYKVISQREAEITNLFNQLTYAKAVEAEQADFLFICKDAAPGQLEEALQQAKTGDLLNPHQSATVIVEANAVAPESELILTGPGIETEHAVQVRAEGNWLEIRAKKNVEYPMGIDLIFVGADHQLVCLPRTTQIRKRVVG